MNLFSLRTLKKYIVSLLISILATIAILGVVSVIFSFFPPAPWLLYSFSNYSVFFTVFLCAFLSARSSSGQGLLIGIIAAVFCLTIITVTGSLLFGTTAFPYSFLKLLPIGIPCGGIGGILGINSK